MAYEARGVEGVKGVGVTVDQGSTYYGDGDSGYWVVVAVPGGEETDGEGWTFKNEGTGYYPPYNFVVDAPAEAMEQYAAEQEAKRQRARERYAETVRIEQMSRAREPFKGREVEVVSGRKVPVGTKGTVFWYGEGQWGWRVGFKEPGSDEALWTAASNVRVVNPEQYAPEAFAEQAAYEAQQAVAA